VSPYVPKILEKGKMEVIKPADVAKKNAASFRLTHGEYARYARYDVDAYYLTSFVETVGEYTRILGLSPTRASRYADHRTDIIRATQAALNNETTLLEVWRQLAEGQPAERELAQHVIKGCGRIYNVRGLEPWRYCSRTQRRPN
jgi:hypothetical protein